MRCSLMLLFVVVTASLVEAKLETVKLPGGFQSAVAYEMTIESSSGIVKRGERLFPPFWDPKAQAIYPGVEIDLKVALWRGAGKKGERIEIETDGKVVREIGPEEILKGAVEHTIRTNSWQPGHRYSLTAMVYNRDRRDVLGGDLEPLIVSVMSKQEWQKLYRPMPQPTSPPATQPRDHKPTASVDTSLRTEFEEIKANLDILFKKVDQEQPEQIAKILEQLKVLSEMVAQIRDSAPSHQVVQASAMPSSLSQPKLLANGIECSGEIELTESECKLTVENLSQVSFKLTGAGVDFQSKPDQYKGLRLVRKSAQRSGLLAGKTYSLEVSGVDSSGKTVSLQKNVVVKEVS